MLQILDREGLRKSFASARPYPFVKIDNFLDSKFALEVANAFPSFNDALAQGKKFATLNERQKIQITDSSLFCPPIARLNAALSSPEFLSDLSYITGLPNLLADEKLIGGGIHVTGPGGRLDVHVDFNFVEESKLHRRINLLLYLNPVWEERWGGHIQLWDQEVKRCEAAFSPALNRCVIFETSNISYHGVTPVAASAPTPRQSFAAYYYTREAPPYWNGVGHGTLFKARPDEWARGFVLMPAESIVKNLQMGIRRAKDGVKKLIGI